jgi:hypothetical protein
MSFPPPTPIPLEDVEDVPMRFYRLLSVDAAIAVHHPDQRRVIRFAESVRRCSTRSYHGDVRTSVTDDGVLIWIER